jgi:hypothetical protein
MKFRACGMKGAFISLFLEQGIEGFCHIVLWGGGAAAFFHEDYTIVRLEEVAEVGAAFIHDVIGLTFGTLITSAWIEEATIFAAVHVRLTMRTFILAPNCADDLDFASTTMTNHDGRKDNKLIRYEANH